MADTSKENDTESPKIKCYAHLAHVIQDIKPVTETSWTKFLESVHIWKDLGGTSGEIARSFVAEHDGSDGIPGSGLAMPSPIDGGFHRKCYQYFTDSTKQKRALLAKQKKEANLQALSAADNDASTRTAEVASDTEPAEKKTRILRSDSGLERTRAARSGHVLPRMCIICRGARYTTDRDGKRKKQPLVQCELIGGGKLLEAAKLKRDENLLLHIENRDCVAIELRYHASCHKDYTRFLSKPQSVTVNVPSARQSLGESFTVTDDLVTALEMFVCKLYAQHDYSHVNEARYAMFSMATKAENVMPPNRDALHKHTERANFQAAIYKRSLEQHPDIPSPVGHGWKMVDDTLGIDWMDKESAQQSVLELAKCSCSKSKCKVREAGNKCCVSLGISCTELCSCKNCENLSPPIDNEDIEESEGEDDVGDNGDEESGENFNT